MTTSRAVKAFGGTGWFLAIIAGLEQLHGFLYPSSLDKLQAQYTQGLEIIAKACQ